MDQTPEAVAVVFEDKQLTYRELNSRANRLANYLRRRGVGPEVLVGICIERSLEMVVGLLGILKAGGAYVPLDPAYPHERLSFMLKDAKAGVLLTQRALGDTLASHQVEVIALDADWQKIANERDENSDSHCSPENFAYVIYTSGSTGRPKGVSVSHASVVHLIRECQAVFTFGIDDVWSTVHSYAFDLSVWEIFGALLSASRLVVVPLQVTQSPSDFLQLLRRQRITILNLTPSAARQLIDATKKPPSGDDLSLRLFICGGEPLPSSLAAELLEWKIPLWNFYGPTEGTVWATIKKVAPENLTEGSISIGRVICDLETYILDEKLRPVSAGLGGELHLGGLGLARGYLNRPELTAERFVPNAFSNQPGARLYKTGDLARYLPDGDIEHLGRLDHQVKVRGFRIELEEIESAIAQHPTVREAVVTAPEDNLGQKRLVAYVVTKARENGDSSTRLDDQRLSDWKVIWNETYKQPSQQHDPTFNIIGWNSSYTGLPYTDEEMREWLDHTVGRILALRPKRVLEIGCGSGLLLFRISPECESYFGTEPSETALALLHQQLEMSDPRLSHVALSERMADDFQGFAPESFDTVIINSVTQYFPSVEYLLRVLEGAIRVTRSGGSIFIGDVRDLPLLEAFHTSVQLSQAPNSLSAIDFRERVRRNILQDEQLAIDPSFFNALSAHLPRISDVQVQLKRGRAQNETTKFRYDVCLSVGTGSRSSTKYLQFDWKTRQLSLPEVRRLLVETGPQNLLISNVPNAHLLSELKSSELIAAGGIETVGYLRARLREEIKDSGVDPEEWWRIGDEFKCSVGITWSATGKRECYDVLLSPGGLTNADTVTFPMSAEAKAKKDWHAYGNDPLQGAFTRRLVPQLRGFIRERLPEYMVPSVFVLLDALPLTPNAKIDRAALPAPDSARPQLEEAFVPPRNELEAKLAEIWEAVLKIDRVGVDDNFIELGGHSVLATQIISRMRDAFHVELPLGTIFESPTIAGLAEKIERARRGREAVESPAPGHVSRDARLPLSFAQERLWFLDQLMPGTPVYNMPSAVRLSCALNVATLAESLNEIVRRHESLRTTIAIEDGRPIQVVAPDLSLELPVIDLTQLSETEREGETQRLANQEAELHFDLAKGPLLRTCLLKLTEQEYVFLLTMHHIISDNWSVIVFFEELSILYEAFTVGRSSSLGELPIQYADYAAWQRDERQREVLQAQLEYWRTQLAGAPTVLELPADKPRPVVMSFRAERQSVTLSSSLVKALRMMSRREGATTFMTLLAVFNVLLHRYTGQDDILVGAPIANRIRTETEGLIGLFLNNLVLRTRLSPESSFRDLLQHVRETALGAYAHQDVPFEKLVEEMQPKRDLGRMPLFQVFFNLFDSADNRVMLSGVTAEVFSPVEAWSQFDLTLYAAERDAIIELTLAYSSNLFGPDRMAEMLEQFRHLLEQIVSEPDKQISKYSLRTAKALSVLPDPTTVLPQPHHEPTTETFFSRARALPDHPAIYKGDDSWSYRELAQEARKLAGALLDDGVMRGDVVVVSGPPSFVLVASMLAILGSAGVLLTLDRNLPSERQKLIVREASAKWLLYVGEWRLEDDWMRELPSLNVLHVDENEGGSRQLERLVRAEDIELPELSPDDPAYIFFTSGTSGVPKGVLGCHKGLSHFLKWQRETFAVGSEDRCAQLTGLSFDVVLRDIFLPLTSGASLHIPEERDSSGAGQLLGWLESEKVTVIHAVPALAQTWLSNIPSGVKLRSLRRIFFAGEPLTDTLVQRWREAFPESGEIVNLYGPTETTLAKCFYEVPADLSPGIQPVGWPLPETQALVLGKRGELSGIGELGEITLRTPFRTLGYFNAPEENQKRFGKNPFRDEEEDLLYFTGDRGRYRPDGALEIVGRLDDQVKIRGVRVEPAEVTAVLARHPSLQSCIVVACKDAQGENALAAYIVASNNRGPISAELRAYLGRQLPAAMVPAYFVFMNKLPLTPNGKVDRRALPEPEVSASELEQDFVEPRNSIEKIVAGIWSDVLGIERVSVLSDFFELGGHSMLATQIISRLRDALRIELPLSSIFESPTVAGLSELVEEARKQELEVGAPAIRALPRERRRTTVY